MDVEYVDRRKSDKYSAWSAESPYSKSEIHSLIQRAKADPRYAHMLRQFPLDVEALRAALDGVAPATKRRCAYCGQLEVAGTSNGTRVLSVRGLAMRYLKALFLAPLVPLALICLLQLTEVPGIGDLILFIMSIVTVVVMGIWLFLTFMPWLFLFILVAPVLWYSFMRLNGLIYASEEEADGLVKNRCPLCNRDL